MGPKANTEFSCGVYDKETGELVTELGTVTELTTETDLRDPPELWVPAGTTMEVEMPVSEELLRFRAAENSKVYDIEAEVRGGPPIRRHKKRRINKKWNKKFGYKYRTKKLKLEGWTADFNGESCTFTKA